jgi:hypothetical protein
MSNKIYTAEDVTANFYKLLEGLYENENFYRAPTMSELEENEALRLAWQQYEIVARIAGVKTRMNE